MSKKQVNKNEKKTYLPLMEMYFEEEDSSEVQDREHFSEILNHEDIKLINFPHITGRPIESDIVDDENEDKDENDEKDTDDIPKPPITDDIIIQNDDAREDIRTMIEKDEFYPFDCRSKKKSIVTTCRILYLLQRLNTLSMDDCTSFAGEDTRRIYDTMNILSELGLVKKVHVDGKSANATPQRKGDKKRKKYNLFKFCSDVTTDNPIDFKDLKKYTDIG